MSQKCILKSNGSKMDPCETLYSTYFSEFHLFLLFIFYLRDSYKQVLMLPFGNYIALSLVIIRSRGIQPKALD